MLAPNKQASATRRREACCHHSLPWVTHETNVGVTSANALTFESVPRHHIDQSGPAPLDRNIESTNAAVTKDTRQVTTALTAKNSSHWRRSSKSFFGRPSRRTSVAIAVTNRILLAICQHMRQPGMPAEFIAATCAGTTPASNHHSHRPGVTSNAASRAALEGQATGMPEDGNRSAKPSKTAR
jgi:hypothetical protein